MLFAVSGERKNLQTATDIRIFRRGVGVYGACGFSLPPSPQLGVGTFVQGRVELCETRHLGGGVEGSKTRSKKIQTNINILRNSCPKMVKEAS